MADSKIPQTHRAILFERFSDQSDNSAPNLFDYLSLYDNDDDLNKNIEKDLEVKSFDEFLKKFPLSVFEYSVSSASGGLPRIQYTTNTDLAKNYPDNREVKLTDHGYFEMLFDMYSKKGTSGVANIEFNDAKIREILTPKREIEKLYDLRRQIPMLMERKEVLLKKNENPIAIDKKLKEIRRNVIEQSKNPTALLAIKLADTKQKIEMIDSSLKALGTPSENEGEEVKLITGSIGFDDNGKLLLIPAKTSDVDSTESTDSEIAPQQRYLQLMSARIDKDITKYSAQMNEPTKALVISAYTGIDTKLATPISSMGRAELIQYREDLVESKADIELMFKQTEENFVKELSNLVQKVLCVKIFFDHATARGTLSDAGLIVTNCKASKLLQSTVKTKFVDLMQRLGTKSTDKKLWFAILPQVVNGEDVFSFDDDDYDDDDLGFDTAEGEVKVTNKDFVDFNDAKELLKIMDDCKITTVFNFKPAQDTTFSYLTAEKINSLKQDLKSVGYEHAVYAIPNFTIMKEGSVPVSDEIGAVKIPVPAVYVDASYVAAGLLIASQQNDFWSAKGFKNEVTFLNNNACVRIDFESTDAKNALLTKFNRERYIAWSDEVDNAFTKDRFGFAFAGDHKFNSQSNKFIDNTYILNARTLKLVEGEYQPIFATLTKDFMETYWLTYNGTKEDLKDFNKIISEWKRQNDKFADKKIINFVLKAGEDIAYNDDQKKFEIQLKSGEKILDISFGVEIK